MVPWSLFPITSHTLYGRGYVYLMYACLIHKNGALLQVVDTNRGDTIRTVVNVSVSEVD